MSDECTRSAQLLRKRKGRKPGSLADSPTMNDLARQTAELDAVAQADLVKSDEVRPAELVEAAISRIEALNDGPTLILIKVDVFEQVIPVTAPPVPLPAIT